MISRPADSVAQEASTNLKYTAGANGPKFLLFQLMTADMALLGRPETPHIGDKILMETFARQLLNSIGERGDHETTQLGFVVGPLSWDLSDEQIRGTIHDAFGIAEKYDIAVGFHIDDSMFWNKRQDLWSNRNNIEWTDWAETVPHRIIAWADRGRPLLAPPMCYNSPAIEAEVVRRGQDVIGAEIKGGLDHLKSIGKPFLFAGVISGWETRLQDDSNPPVYYGYCALHNLGYSADHPPNDLDKVLEGVVHDWLALWTSALEQAGIPKDRIFTHIAYPGPYTRETAQQLRGIYKNPDALRDYYKDSSPNVTAFNIHSYPGFSVYGADKFESLYRILASQGSPPWGVSEGTNIDLSNAFTNGTMYVPDSKYVPSATMEQYLGHAFNHGAVYVNLFGWSDSGGSNTAFGAATKGISALKAYQKFLRGERLSEDGATQTRGSEESSQAPSDVLSESIDKIHRAAPAWLQMHPDRQNELGSLLMQLEQYMKIHNPGQAQHTAEMILSLMGEK
jgi:hypothetical protein